MDEAQAGIKIAGRNIKNLRYGDDITLMAQSEEELKSILIKVKEESEKVGFKLNIQKTKIMASGPITSCEIDGETVETVADFIWGGSRITADGDCSHEIKRHLTPWKESYDQPRQCIQKHRHYFANKGPSSQGYCFSRVMYGCESRTIKTGELQKIDASELWCWRRLLRVPWTARRSNQSIQRKSVLNIHWKD